MLSPAAFILGVLFAVLFLLSARKNPASLGSWTLAGGLMAGAAFLISNFPAPTVSHLVLVLRLAAIGLASATVATGLVSLRQGNRNWPTWAGLAAGLAIVVFWVGLWVSFALGHPLDPRL
jgi:hypothetical protein